MTELLTAAQMRAIERAAIDSGAVTGLDLMERAGRGVVDAVLAEWPELARTSHRAVVLCGPGNNGGDGFVVARLLRQRGWDVEVFLWGDPERLPPDARANRERWAELGDLHGFPVPPDRLGADVLVDAAFGTGLTRAMPAEIGTAVAEYTSRSPGGRIVSVDVPSGLCSDSGKTLGQAPPVSAALTVTFHRPRIGHFLDLGPDLCGRLATVDIGLEGRFGPPAGAEAPALGDGRAPPFVPPGERVELAAPGIEDLRKTGGSHKYSHGHALVLSGPPGRTGAARLAARGALRIGAGLVTLGVPPAAQQEAAAQLTAVMLTRTAGAGALSETLEDGRINALCIGPGFGTGDREADLLRTGLRRGDGSGGAGATRRTRTVLDADAITLLANHPGLFDALHGDCVLTPHAGEFRRLFPDIAERLAAPADAGPAYSKVDATREAAARAGCVVLFKGPDTVVAAPEGRCAINASAYDRAAPWLATAGAGDVLSGFITGLLARGFGPFHAAVTGAWLHTECARDYGPGLIAEDLPETLPRVLARLTG